MPNAVDSRAVRAVSLDECGITDHVRDALRDAQSEIPDAVLGRVLSIHYGGLFVAMPHGIERAEPSGTFRRAMKKRTA